MNIKIAMILALVGIMTLCLVVTKPLANQAFALIPCFLTLKATPGSVAHTPPEGTPQDLTGQLICGGKGNHVYPVDAVIHLVVVPSGKSQWTRDVKTDDSGNFVLIAHGSGCPGASCVGLVVSSPTSYIITAKYDGDRIHEAANPVTITITTTPS